VWWRAVCIATVIPLTAVLHNRIFLTSTCMIHPFGDEYTFPVVRAWLSGDPSLPWAIILAGVAWNLGRFRPWLKLLVAPVFASFLPVSLWVWDIPFTGRYICYHFHDNEFQVAAGVPLTSAHVYALSLLLYLLFVAVILRKNHGVVNPES